MKTLILALAGAIIGLAVPVPASAQAGTGTAAEEQPAGAPSAAEPIGEPVEEPAATTALVGHPHIDALQAAYAAETDPARRATLASNLERWSRMPAALGARYLIVNAAAFEVSLWEGRREMRRWRAIVGTVRTPTPIFQAEVSGVIFNPWWEVPASIAAEGIASMVQNRPDAARQRGYVYQNGRYRQRPGPGNALGLMKLVMPNPHSVFLHDTSNRSLFDRDVRTLSHGCVRVGDALDFASELLATRPGWNRARTDEVVASGQTMRIDLPEPIPVYVGYFTAEPDENGAIRYFPDVYNRDRQSAAMTGIGDAPEGADPHCRLS